MWSHVGYIFLYMLTLVAVQVQWRYCVPVCTQVLKASQALLFVGLVRLYSSRDQLQFDIEPHFAALQEILNKTISN